MQYFILFLFLLLCSNNYSNSYLIKNNKFIFPLEKVPTYPKFLDNTRIFSTQNHKWRFVSKSTTNNNIDSTPTSPSSSVNKVQGKVVLNSEGNKVYIRGQQFVTEPSENQKQINSKKTNYSEQRKVYNPTSRRQKLQPLLLIPLIIPKSNLEGEYLRNNLLSNIEFKQSFNSQASPFSKSSPSASSSSSSSKSSSTSSPTSSSLSSSFNQRGNGNLGRVDSHHSKKGKAFNDGASNVKKKKKSDIDDPFGLNNKKFSGKNLFNDEDDVTENIDIDNISPSSTFVSDEEIMIMHESGLSMEEMLEEIYEKHGIVISIATIRKKLYLLYHSKKTNRKSKNKSSSKSIDKNKKSEKIINNIYDIFSKQKNINNFIIIPTPNSNNFFNILTLSQLLSISPLNLLIKLKKFHITNSYNASKEYNFNYYLSHSHLVDFLKHLEVNFVENEDFVFKKELQNEDLLENIENPLDLDILPRVFLPSYVMIGENQKKKTKDVTKTRETDVTNEYLVSDNQTNKPIGLIDLVGVNQAEDTINTPCLSLLKSNESFYFTHKISVDDITNEISFVNLSPIVSSLYTNSTFLFPNFYQFSSLNAYILFLNPSIKYDSLDIPSPILIAGKEKPHLIPVLVSNSKIEKNTLNKVKTNFISQLSEENFDKFQIDFTLPLISQNESEIINLITTLTSSYNFGSLEQSEVNTYQNEEISSEESNSKSKKEQKKNLSTFMSGKILDINYFSSNQSKNKQKKQFLSTILLDSLSGSNSLALRKNDFIINGLNKGKILNIYDYKTKKEIKEAKPGDLVDIYGIDYSNTIFPYLNFGENFQSNNQEINEMQKVSSIFYSSNNEKEIQELYIDNMNEFKEYNEKLQEKHRLKKIEDLLKGDVSTSEKNKISLPLIIRTNNLDWYNFLINLFDKKLLDVNTRNKEISPYVASIGLGDIQQKDEQLVSLTSNSLLISLEKPISHPFKYDNDAKKIEKKRDDILTFNSLESFLSNFYSIALKKINSSTSHLNPQSIQAIGKVKKIFRINNKNIIGLKVELGNLKFNSENKDNVRIETYHHDSSSQSISTFNIKDFASTSSAFTQLIKSHSLSHESNIESLKIGPNPATEVPEGKECGISIVDSDIKPNEGDIIVFYKS